MRSEKDIKIIKQKTIDNSEISKKKLKEKDIQNKNKKVQKNFSQKK